MTKHRDTSAKALDLPDLIRSEVWRDGLLPMLRLPEGTAVDDVRIARVYPSRLDGFGVQAEVSIIDGNRNRGTGFVYLTSGMKARGSASRRLRVQTTSPFLLSSAWCPLDQLPFVLHTADRDDGLPCLPQASSRRHYPSRLRTISGVPSLVTGAHWRCVLGNYRPRRRCTLLYRNESPANASFVVGKMFRSGQATRHGANARRLSTALRRTGNDVVVAPRVRAVWANWNMVIFEGLGSGKTHNRPDTFELSRPAATTLACLHRASIDGLPAFGPKDELNATGRWVELADRLGRLRPNARRIWATLGSSAPPSNGARRRVIHRDFYASQLLPLGERWGLVDFDTAALGDPEQDIANFLGHMIWDGICTGRCGHDWLDAGSEFVSQYVDAVNAMSGSMGLRPARISAPLLRFYLSSSLLRVGIIHSLRSGCERRALQLHRVASECMTELLESDLMDRRVRAAV